MCKLVPVITNYGEEVFVADVKKDFIKEVIKSAEKCSSIEKVVIFGSASRVDCKDTSDVDIAVFTNSAKSTWLISEDAFKFVNNLYDYNIDEEFDLIHRNLLLDDLDSMLSKNIKRGVVIYVKQ